MKIKVVAVKANADFSLDLEFNDKTAKRFDVKPYLNLGVFNELRDFNYFKQVSIAYGTVQWPHEQDFGPDTLYIEGRSIERFTNGRLAEENA